LVKNVEQIDSIQETDRKPRFFRGFHGFSGSFAGRTRGFMLVPAVSQLQFAPLPEPTSGEVFDEAHFIRQTFGDRGLQVEIIQLFIAQVEDSRKALAAPMTTTAWRFMTHTLKGAASAVGAMRIAKLAGGWELAGSPQDASGRAAIAAQFEAETTAFAAAASGYRS
jgi:HPt (histidine-containing phosphotransfer) domain-containing protein